MGLDAEMRGLLDKTIDNVVENIGETVKVLIQRRKRSYILKTRMILH
jgi:hypothetical protein